jgi:cellulose synthase/poly-beta-1,6-N-acetylglucosamine synthase-like glycosyltransferase
MTGLGRPLSCIGNNFTFRRQTYEEVGGYENIPFSVTEDLILFKTIARKTGWRIKFPIDEKTLVISDPSPDWKSFFLQQKRWVLGGFDLSWNGLAIIFTSYFFHIFLFAGFFLFPGASLVVFLFKIACDAWLISPAIRKIKRGDYWVYFWAFQTIYYIEALVLQMILLWNRKVIWKGRKY